MQRVLIAQNGTATAFRVSKPGKVTTSGDLGDYLIHEQLVNAAPIAILNIVSLTVTSASGSSVLCQYIYPHGLPFVPLVKGLTAFGSISGAFSGQAPTFTSYLVIVSGNPTGGAQALASVEVDATNVTMNVYPGWSALPSVGAIWTPASPILIAVFGVAV